MLDLTNDRLSVTHGLRDPDEAPALTETDLLRQAARIANGGSIPLATRAHIRALVQLVSDLRGIPSSLPTLGNCNCAACAIYRDALARAEVVCSTS